MIGYCPRVSESGSAGVGLYGTLAALDQPDDERDEAGEHEDRQAEDCEQPSLTFESGDITTYFSVRIACDFSTHRRQVATDFRA